MTRLRADSHREISPFSVYRKKGARDCKASFEEMENFLGAFFYLPRSKRQILRNFDFILPKFHFILPNFYFAPLWRIFVCSLVFSDYLRGDRFWWRVKLWQIPFFVLHLPMHQ